MGGATVDDEVDGVSQAALDVLGGQGVGAAAGVGAGADDGLAEGAGEGAGDVVVGDADADGAGGAEEGVRETGDGFEDEGEGAGPEGAGEGVEVGGIGQGDEFNVVGVCEEEGEALLGAAALDAEDSGEGRGGKGVATEAI